MKRIRNLISMFGAMLMLIAVVPKMVHAGFLYDFIENAAEGSRVIARLELASLPATESEFVSLTFTPLGEQIFGYSSYPGTFDRMSAERAVFVGYLNPACPACDLEAFNDDDGSQLASMIDNDPPLSSLPDLESTMFFELQASTFDGFDNIRLRYRDKAGSQIHVVAAGDWRSVPEPSGFLLSFLPVLCSLHVVFRH